LKLVAVDSPIVRLRVVAIIEVLLPLLPTVVGKKLFVIPGLALALLILKLLTCVDGFIDIELIWLTLSVICTIVV
jgi:hypothetical protein